MAHTGKVRRLTTEYTEYTEGEQASWAGPKEIDDGIHGKGMMSHLVCFRLVCFRVFRVFRGWKSGSFSVYSVAGDQGRFGVFRGWKSGSFSVYSVAGDPGLFR